MRILLIYQYFLADNESGHTRWNEMVKLWAGDNHEITVLTGMVNYSTGLKQDKYKGKYFAKEKQGNHIEIVRCYVSEAYNKNFSGRLWAYLSFTFSGIWAVMTKLNGKYDLVLVSSPPLFVGIIGYIASKVKKIPMVFEVRDLWPESAIDTGLLTNKFIICLAYWLEKFIYKNSRLINVLTPAFQEVLLTIKKIPQKKVIVVPNAADFSIAEDLIKFDSVSMRKELGWIDKFVILYVGAHGLSNNLIQIVQTAELLKGTNAHFVLIGNGMEREKLILETKKRKLTNVEFISPVPKAEVYKYILACNAGTSVLKKNDTFKTVYSSKTFDYMACKKPILMAIDGVSRKLIEEANAGLFVEPEDPVDFASKVRFYVTHPEFAVQQGINGYNHARLFFDRKILADKYIDYIKNI